MTPTIETIEAHHTHRFRLAVVVDAIVLRDNDDYHWNGRLIDTTELLLVRRAHEPFMGKWALPGGFVKSGETVKAAAQRELREETGLETDEDFFNFFTICDSQKRLAANLNIGVVYIASWHSGDAVAADDAAEARWFRLKGLPELAFDHADIIDKLGEVF